MPRIDISGIGIDYELYGERGAPAAVITPGGTLREGHAGCAAACAGVGRSRVASAVVDRPNCGASDVSFDGESESGLHARVLSQLIRKLDLGRVAVLGGSAGSRVSLIAAARDPEIVSHLVIWWISGGPISLAQLAAYYCGDSAMAAARGGMAAVAALPGWAEQIALNPKNREIILAQNPETFVEKMQQWAAAYGYSDSSPVPGMKAEDFARLAKIPVLVFRSGQSDVSHTRRTSEWVHQLIPHSSLIEPPWPDQEWNNCMAIPNDPGRGRFERWPMLAPQILEFLRRRRE